MHIALYFNFSLLGKKKKKNFLNKISQVHCEVFDFQHLRTSVFVIKKFNELVKLFHKFFINMDPDLTIILASYSLYIHKFICYIIYIYRYKIICIFFALCLQNCELYIGSLTVCMQLNVILISA